MEEIGNLDTITPNSDDLAVKSYNRRKLNRLKRRRKMRRLKILLARLRILGRLAFYVIIIWGVFKAANLPFWYLDKNIFHSYPSQYLELEGYNIVSAKQVMKKLKEIELPQKPLYLINTKPIEEKLEEMPPIKRIFIRRYWLPARLRVVIDERTPVISIAPNSEVDPIAVFTLDGHKVKILEKKYLPLPEEMETYRIITYDDYKTWKPAQIPYIQRLAMYLESATGDKLEYLDIRNPDDVYAQLKNVRLRLGGLKGNEIFERIQKVSSVIPEAMKIKDNINYIDLRWHNVSIKLKKNE